MEKRANRLWSKPMVCIALLLALLIAALYQGLTVQTWRVEATGLKQGQSVRMVVIADLHNDVYGFEQHELIGRIRAQRPDLILLTGDIVDENSSIEGTKMLLGAIQNLAPIYYVTGNHEYWTRHVDEVKAVVSSYGVHVLSDEYAQLEINGVRLVIAGVEDIARKTVMERYSREASAREAFTRVKRLPGYKIVLSHRPENMELFAELGFDLALSGHIHGGQVRIPFTDIGLFGAHREFMPKVSAGVYTYGRLTNIVSRGLSRYSPKLPPRVFNPPELVVVELVAARQ